MRGAGGVDEQEGIRPAQEASASVQFGQTAALGTSTIFVVHDFEDCHRLPRNRQSRLRYKFRRPSGPGS